LIELVLVSIVVGFIAFFVFLKVLGGLVKTFLFVSFLIAVVFVVRVLFFG